MSKVILPSLLADGFHTIINQMPGYFLWKDLQSNYLTGCIKTAKLFGFNDTDSLSGIADYDIQCEAAEYASLFVMQDHKLKQSGTPISVLDVHPYHNGEVKNLLINKSLLKDESANVVGISCHCTEINNLVLDEIAVYLAKMENKKIFEQTKVKKAYNYYLNAEYPVKLSSRESECLFYLLRGKSVAAVAKLLGLSARTVEAYVNNIKCKMVCETKPDVIEKAISLGFMEIIPQVILNKNFSRKLKHLVSENG